MAIDPLSTLEKIRIKIRRITKSPSSSKITDDEIDYYVNNFILYDFPSWVTPSFLKTSFVFYTQPFIDRYISSSDVTSDLYNFKNTFVSFFDPIYVSGDKTPFTVDKDEFYTAYPKTMYPCSIGTGDGVTVAYTGTISKNPLLRNDILFSTVDVNNSGLAVRDDGEGSLVGDCVAGGVIDYITGIYTFTFNTAPKALEDIVAEVIYYEASKPSYILYDGSSFILRPVPDRPYKIEISAYTRPTELMLSSSLPELSQWWQYIAYGSAKKVFEDRGNTQGVIDITPEFENQEELIRNKLALDNTNRRVATIYTDPNIFI